MPIAHLIPKAELTSKFVDSLADELYESIVIFARIIFLVCRYLFTFMDIFNHSYPMSKIETFILKWIKSK